MTLDWGGGEQSSPPIALDPKRVVGTPEMVRLQIRETLKRGLPTLQICKPHRHEMSIVAGGPSAADTLGELVGCVAAVNKAHDWLLEQGKKPHYCGLLDPVPWLVHYVTPHDGVQYFVASQCHALVFDKLKDHKVAVWHASHGEDRIPILDLLPPESVVFPGGTSMALRWLELGYALGFRKFHFHGFDCSHRKGRHHVYDFPQDDNMPVKELMGYTTSSLWLAQINDFFLRTEFFRRDETMDPIEIVLHGDGLVQHLWKEKTGTNVYRK